MQIKLKDMFRKICLLFIAFMFSAVLKAQEFKDTDSSIKMSKAIPTDFAGKPIYIYNLVRKTANELKLKDAEYGFDSLEIRIWPIVPGYERKVILIKKDPKGWSGVLYSFLDSSSGVLKNLNVVVKSRQNLQPISGWDSLFNSLNTLGITTLPDDSKLTDYPVGADGYYYCFEVATKKNYRFYHYWIPEEFKNKFIEANKITAIIQKVETEFGIALK